MRQVSIQTLLGHFSDQKYDLLCSIVHMKFNLNIDEVGYFINSVSAYFRHSKIGNGLEE